MKFRRWPGKVMGAMTYNQGSSAFSLQGAQAYPAFNEIDDLARQWRLLGRARVDFVRDMRPFANCPADIFYWMPDSKSQQFARDIEGAMREAGWNVTFAPSPKKIEGIKVITRSPSLHAEEILGLVACLRSIGFEAKVRVRPELETESVQILIGAGSRAGQTTSQ